MKYHMTQSGFTPTPNFAQSVAKRFRRAIDSGVSRIKLIIRRREQSSQHKNWCRGFSLVETLVAISILLIVMIGPMTISSSAARSTSFSSEQVTAFFLAQEGAELAQKVRDDLQLVYFSGTANNPWTTFTNTNGTYQSCYSANGCGLNVNTTNTGTVSVLNCGSSGAACALYFNGASNNLRSRFTYTAGTNSVTPFTRKVTFQNVNANEVKVISRVTWRSGSFRQEQKVEVETRLFNVYGN